MENKVVQLAVCPSAVYKFTKKNFYLRISEVYYSADAFYKTATNMTVLIKLGMIYAQF